MNITTIRGRRRVSALCGTILAAAALTLTSTAAHAANGEGVLRAGETLISGQSLVAGTDSLVMQGDGNLVLYGSPGVPYWASNTSGHNGARVTMQADGNLVIYDGATAIWASNTAGATSNTYALVLQADNNIVLRNPAGTASWASNTMGQMPIHVTYNGRCLDSDLNTIGANGTKVQLWDCNGQSQQVWSMWADGTVHNAYNGRCLDADLNTIGANGTKIQLWDCNGQFQQKWTRMSDGTLRSQRSNRCLDADLNTIGANGTRVQLWDCNGQSQQRWPFDRSAMTASIIRSNPRIALTGRLVADDVFDAWMGRNGTAGTPVSGVILSLVAGVGQTHSVLVTALESGGTGHSTGSWHYLGRAVDFGSYDGRTLTGRDAGSVAIINVTKSWLPAGSGYGQSNCGATPPLPTGITTFTDTCTHLHIQSSS